MCIRDRYEYVDGYWIEMDDKQIESKIAKYFNVYQDTKGKNAYAKPHFIKSALQYLKMSTQVSSNEAVNPPGLNVNNGFIQLSYKDNGPHFELVPHSIARICTYKGRVAKRNTDLRTLAL